MSGRTKEPVRFLLVDDREDNLLVLEALLQRDGLELLLARSGDEALELLLVHDVALALLDVQMPGMDGFTLAELMRGLERSRHVPIIFVTAGPQERHRVFRGYDAGAVDFLFKPIDPTVLHHKADTFFHLYRQRQELEETLRLYELFMAAVGHDLKSPLNAVVLAAQLLREKVQDRELREVVERLYSSSNRMNQMIDDLFDLARARLGSGIPLEREPVDLGVVVSRLVAEYAVSHHGRVTVEVQGDVTGEWDSRRLAQVAQNLLGNALRHGASDAPVTVRVQDQGEFVCLSVHNGGTIAPSLMPYLFDPFRSGESRAHSKGLGLGLYIVHQLVLAHDGSTEVHSEPGAGTTFTVRLPRRAAEPAGHSLGHGE